ncbi:MAG: protein phosphatase CheZ, partial [Sphingomonadales bacterium]|nr:protein phosphatase CheZ [Sphingomonadales bacterium]
MNQEELPNRIRELVDHLREHDESRLSITDIASVTEVLIASTSSLFKSIDSSVFNEFRDLSNYIQNARVEIASLQPVDLEGEHIPRAGMELDLIVKSTEEATDTIMESAETIMNAIGGDVEVEKPNIENAVMQIFEACSFQDITGQRISKVVETLSHIEKRISDLGNLLGISDVDESAVAVASEKNKLPEKHDVLARGPSLAGEGIDQSAVDALLNGGGDEAPAPSEAPAPAPVETPATPAAAPEIA